MAEPQKFKQFEITLVRRNDGFTAKSIDKVEGDDLVELLAQFLLVIARLQRTFEREMGGLADDDIPF